MAAIGTGRWHVGLAQTINCKMLHKKLGQTGYWEHLKDSANP